jgi:hypothetical protein
MLPVRFTPLMTVPSWVMFVTVLLPSPVGFGELRVFSVVPAGTPVSVQFGHVLDPAANVTGELAHDPGVAAPDELGAEEGDGADEDGAAVVGAALVGAAVVGAAELGAGSDAGFEDGGPDDGEPDDGEPEEDEPEDDEPEDDGGRGAGVPDARDGHHETCRHSCRRSTWCPWPSKRPELPSASSEMVCLAAGVEAA